LDILVEIHRNNVIKPALMVHMQIHIRVFAYLIALWTQCYLLIHEQIFVQIFVYIHYLHLLLIELVEQIVQM
jgi:hypothetical protein